MIFFMANPVTIFIVLCFMYPLIKGFLYKFSSYDLKRDSQGIVNSISFLLALFIGIRYGKLIALNQNVNKLIHKLPENIYSFIDKNPMVIYFIVIPIIIYVIYSIVKIILNFINRITFFKIFDGMEGMLSNKSNIIKRILGAFVQLPRAICYLITVLFIFNIVSMLNINKQFDNYLKTSTTYNYLCKQIVIPVTNSNLAKRLPKIIDNSFKIVVKQNNNTIQKGNQGVSENVNNNTIVYYNGVTLDDGVKSNGEIDNFARNLVANETGTENKARKIYNWIGNNIAYDYDKANLVLNDNYNVKSGAIPTFETRKGICFDYSCLYVAMARANNIKVRLVTGEGFNGVSWVSHAWNQVYIPELKEWINVDTTFAKGGDYFNRKMFSLDHKDDKVIGEW